MKRHLVALTTDIVIDFPDGVELDPSSPEVQKICREQFIDFLQSAEYLELGWEINPDEEEEHE